jgi:class 3 adenylate cyclase
MTEREVRYCTTEDDVRIAYCVEGEGVAVVACPFFIESFAFDHLVPEVVEFWEMLGRGRKLIRYDARGTGLSDRNSVVFDRESPLRDLSSVVDACGVDRFVVWASGIAGPGAIEYTATHPERVSHLILFNTFARTAVAMDPTALEAMASLSESNWPMAAQTFADMTLRREFPEAALRWSEVFLRSASGETVARGFRQSDSSLDVSGLLSKIKARTLVLHRLDGGIAPFDEGQRMAVAIPGARFVPLEGTAAHYSLGDTRPVLNSVDALLGDRSDDASPQRSPSGAPSAFRTILFTDIVGHTEMMQRLGDTKGRAVLRDHERITRETLKQHGGAEVKTMGDGFMASFGSVTSALDCAIALQRAFAQHTAGTQERRDAPSGPSSLPEPITIRVGLNAGEPIEEDGDLFGSTVILASRIAAKAGAGEILIPEPVRHLLSGKNFVFSDRGEFAMKGFDDPVRLYEVRWRPTVAPGDEDA